MGSKFVPLAKKKIMFTKDKQERQTLVKVLRRQAKAHVMTDYYDIGEHIGTGKFAIVKRCTYKKDSKEYAVKIIEKINLDLDANEREALRAEIAIMKLVNHPSIIKMRHVFEDHKHLYLVMPLYVAGDLRRRLHESGHFDEKTVKGIMWNLFNAVNYCHERGIVHRDLKCDNVLCADPLDPTNVLITDFGLSSFIMPKKKLDSKCGTLNYIAPEILKSESYTAAVDIWSLGVIMHSLLSANLPFFGKDEEEIKNRIFYGKIRFEEEEFQNVSDDAKDLITKCLIKKPKDRITLETVLEHPWLSEMEIETDSPRCQTPNGLLHQQLESHCFTPSPAGNKNSAKSWLKS